MKKWVYIAAPYTHGDVVENIREVLETADLVRKYNFVPVVPHLFHFWHLVSPHTRDYWMALDFDLIEKCDIVLRLPGLSPGADEELEFAQARGKEIHLGLESFMEKYCQRVWGVDYSNDLVDAMAFALATPASRPSAEDWVNRQDDPLGRTLYKKPTLTLGDLLLLGTPPSRQTSWYQDWVQRSAYPEEDFETNLNQARADWRENLKQHVGSCKITFPHTTGEDECE